ncbi:virion structural protein (plasmid) [Paenibacillus rhizovicinus]|uniref:Virion structural protein n=1 Tax=Paenibacillus rhizovicinus TaxID=2704463 RepID=A0A6C0PAQ2_9BACL|nr:virion structural protein [Paenibacillus rhizovicinus]QHW35660.1 virion structural protein [Paenibacillus rhizovicinus]
MQRRPTDVDGMQRTFTTYAGTDMVATLNIPGKGPIVFGNLSQISYSIYRAKFPVLALGRVTPKGFTRGMRTVTGILQFTDFDETIVYRCLEEIREQGYKVLMDEMPMFDVTISMANEFGSKSVMTIYGITTFTEGKVMGVNNMFTENVYEFYALDIDPLSKVKRLGG